MATLTLQQLIDNRLASRLGYIQNIEVFGMLCKPTNVVTRVISPYGNYTSTSSSKYVVRKNGIIIVPDATDSNAGLIDIAGLTVNDDVTIDVTFKYFTDTDLGNFYKLALSRLNNAPPFSTYTFDDSTTGDTATYPIDAENYLTQAAYKNAIDTLMTDLMGWRAHIIFRDPQGLANMLQAKSSEIESYLMGSVLQIKGRRNLIPHSISIGKWRTPAQVSDHSWQAFTTIRA